MAAGVRLTPAQAKALGLDVNVKQKNRREAGGQYRTVCVMCGEEFKSIAAEDRHLKETGHPRYALVLG